MKALFTLVIATFLFIGCNIAEVAGTEQVRSQEATFTPYSGSGEKGIEDDRGDVSTAVYSFTFYITAGPEAIQLEMSADTFATASIRYNIKSSAEESPLHSAVMRTTAEVRNRGKFDVATVGPGETESFTVDIFLEAAGDGFYNIEILELNLEDGRQHVFDDFHGHDLFLNRSDRAWMLSEATTIEDLMEQMDKAVDHDDFVSAHEICLIARGRGDNLLREAEEFQMVPQQGAMLLDLLSELLEDLSEKTNQSDRRALEVSEQVVIVLDAFVNIISKG